jgi:hypothetical protein
LLLPLVFPPTIPAPIDRYDFWLMLVNDSDVFGLELKFFLLVAAAMNWREDLEEIGTQKKKTYQVPNAGVK